MRKVLFALLISVSSIAHAGLGVGVVLGDPTGLSFENELGGGNSWDAVLAWSSGKNPGFHLHADYLVTWGKIADLDQHPLELYYGIGGRMIQIDDKDDDDDGKTALGVRAPAGLQVKINDPNIEFFGEIGLVFEVVPSTSADFDVGIGGRYYF